ncbi:hypothetical protein M513_06891 [Trichuris suis]|uniref:Vacuolar protein sorting-associated protein 13 VPS13 adaptor binding domain-containing protein n=1 Tax=Trichuris suis TaxID=68888 RepID=A0A085M4N2_9BILA|nr:hypothetical protein M513_06891 [Trichuris suis]
MFKSFVVGKLKRSLGEFINISDDQIRLLEIIKAKVSLENVPLKRTALRRFKLPVLVRSGSVRQITISLPSLALTNTAVVEMEDIQLFVEFSESEMLLERKGQDPEFFEPNADLPKDPVVTIKISNIHLIYAHDLTKESVCKFVLKIDRLSFKNAEEALGTNANLFLFHITGLRLYRAGISASLSRMLDYWASSPSWAPVDEHDDKEFCLVDISEVKIRLEENASLMAWNILPERTLDIDVDHLSLKWTDSVLSDLIELINSFNWYEQVKYKKFRPNDSVMKSPRQWWKFATTCILTNYRNRRLAGSWDLISQRARNLNRYCAAYVRRIQGKESESDCWILEKTEMDYGFSDITLFRYLAIRKLFRGIKDAAVRHRNWKHMLKLALPSLPEACMRVCEKGSTFSEWLSIVTNTSDNMRSEHDPLADLSYAESGQNPILQLRLRVEAVSISTCATECSNGTAEERLLSHELMNASSVRIVVDMSGLPHYILTRAIQRCNLTVASLKPVHLNVNRSDCKRIIEFLNCWQNGSGGPLSAYASSKYADGFAMSSIGIFVRLPSVQLNFQSNFAECTTFAIAVLKDLTFCLRQDLDLRKLKCYDNVNCQDLLVIEQIGNRKATHLRKWLYSESVDLNDSDAPLNTSGISEDDCSFCPEPSEKCLLFQNCRANDSSAAPWARLNLHYVRLNLCPDLWLILSDFICKFIPSAKNAGTKLCVDIQSYFAEIEVPYATDSRTSGILRLRDCAINLEIDYVGFCANGTLWKLSLRDRASVLQDNYPLKAELLSESHPLKFKFYKYWADDIGLQRRFDGSLRLTSLDRLYIVLTSRFGLNLNSFFQLIADRYCTFLQLKNRTTYSTYRGTFGFRLQLDAELGNVTLIVPENALSSNVLISKIEKLTLHSWSELKQATSSPQQSIDKIEEHLVDKVVAHFQRVVLVKALRAATELLVSEMRGYFYGREYAFVVRNSLCETCVNVEAVFSRHLCPGCVCRGMSHVYKLTCQKVYSCTALLKIVSMDSSESLSVYCFFTVAVNELSANVHSASGESIRLQPDEVRMFRRIVKENFGESIHFLEARTNRELDLRAEFNASPGTRVLMHLDSVNFIFPTNPTPGNIRSGSVRLRDLSVCFEICMYVRSKLLCSFYLEASESSLGSATEQNLEDADGHCKHHLYSLTPGDARHPVEIVCQWSAGHVSIECCASYFRLICVPRWLEAFNKYMLVNLWLESGHTDTTANERPSEFDEASIRTDDGLKVACKFNLIQCQLHIAGNSLDLSSATILAKVTGSFRGTSVNDIVTLNALLDSIQLFECRPYLDKSRTIQISNVFSATLTASAKLSSLVENFSSEDDSSKKLIRLNSTIVCDDVCLRLSLCDLLMLVDFFKAYGEEANSGMNRWPTDCGINIEIDQFNAELDVQYAQDGRNVLNVCGHFKLLSDFYNPNFGAWEPLLEEMEIRNLLLLTDHARQCTNILAFGSPNASEFTVMESTLRQLLQWYQRWPQYWENASHCYREIFTLPTSACCCVKNKCGIPLWVAMQIYGAKVPDDAWVCAKPEESVLLSYSVDYFEKEGVFHELNLKALPHAEPLKICTKRVGSYCKPLAVSSVVKSNGKQSMKTTLIVPVKCSVFVEEASLHSVVISPALRLHNCLPFDLTVHFTPADGILQSPMDVSLRQRATFSVPIEHWRSAISIAIGGKFGYSCPIDWQLIAEANPSRCVAECRGVRSDKYITISVVVTRTPFKGEWVYRDPMLFEHSITFLPVALFVNLLPYHATVQCECNGRTCCLTVPSGGSAPLLSVIGAGLVSVFISVGKFKSLKPFLVNLQPSDATLTFSVPLIDRLQRLLHVNVRSSLSAFGCFEIELRGHFVFINRTNLAIIIKQLGVDKEAAGQTDAYEERAHEEPLLFSFSDLEAPQRCCMRIGLRFGNVLEAPWSDHFPLVKGIAFRDLPVVLEDSTVKVYHIGINIEAMKGPCRGCLLIIFTCRYLLVNESVYTIFVRQSTKDTDSILQVPSNGSSMWHLPFPNLPPLMSIKLEEFTYWTEEFLVDRLTSFTLYLRGDNCTAHFLLVEIVLDGAMYRVKFSGADHLPPPITLLNMSDVPVTFYQKGCSADHLHSTLVPHGFACYNWDSWLREKQLVLSVFDEASLCFNLTTENSVHNFVYRKQFYIIFETKNSSSRAMVMEAAESGFIFLTVMNSDCANQLWEATTDGLLVNVGQTDVLQSSGSSDELVVLDVDRKVRDQSEPFLCVRRAERSRSETQCWMFTNEDSKLRLMSSKNDFASVCSMEYLSPVFLGSKPLDFMNNVMVYRLQTRPGSGTLQVVVTADGPTRQVAIYDFEVIDAKKSAKKKDTAQSKVEEVDKGNINLEYHQARLMVMTRGILSCCFHIPNIGVSVVNEVNEELMYFRLDDVAMNFVRTDRLNKLDVEVYGIQGDNQLQDANSWQFLKVHPELPEGEKKFQPALTLQIHWRILADLFDFQRVVIKLDRTVLQLEENLLWKLFNLFDLNRWTTASHRSKLRAHSRRKSNRLFYVGTLCVSIKKLFLSVMTSSLLPKQLLRIKREHNFPLICFQNAPVDIIPFRQMECLQSIKFFATAINRHFSQTLRNQAMKILGSVDFLGNPVGLFRELSGGIHELVVEGNLSGFIYGLWHGLSNSAARFTSALAEGVGIISMDNCNDEYRSRLTCNSPQSAVEHLVAGMRDFGAGLFGGMTSLVSNAVDGALDYGVQGLVSGIARGLVGTVAKPVQGILALASGAATAAKEAVSKNAPLQAFFSSKRLRPSRPMVNFDLTVPKYDRTLVEVAAELFKDETNENCFEKQVLAVLRLNEVDETVVLFTACPRRFYILKCQSGTTTVVANNSYSEVRSDKLLFEIVGNKEKVYVVIVFNVTDVEVHQLKIECSNEDIARTLLRLLEQGGRLSACLTGALEADVESPCVCSGNSAETFT